MFLKSRLKSTFSLIAVMMGLSLLVAACGDPDPLPTSAPRIPTHTPLPSVTATREIIVVTVPPAQESVPSWTPIASETPAPTRTLAPSLTPRPSATPRPELTPGIEQLEGGIIRLTASATDLNQALSSQPNTPQFVFEPDGMQLMLAIPNTFLNENSRVNARLTPTLNAAGFTLTLDSYTSEGPAVTRTEVRTAVQNVAPILNDYLKTQVGAEVEFLRFEMNFDFLIVEMQ